MEFSEAALQAYLAAAYLNSPDTSKDTHVGQGKLAGTTVQFAVSAMQGWRSTMEDAHIAQVGFPNQKDVAFFGVFDGHGGDMVAKYVEQHLVEYMQRCTHFAGMKKDKPNGKSLGLALTESFMELDEDMKELPAVASGRDESGSTGVACFLTSKEIIIANTGDSRMVVVTSGKPSFATEDHKPYNHGERTRIERAGGVVEMDRVNGDLASSRSFGDFMYKRDTSRPPNQQLISVQPDITIVKRNSSDQFLLIACDGVWDVFSNDEAGAYVLSAMKLGCGLGKCCELLMDECLERDSRDNISVILVALPNAPKELGKLKPSANVVDTDEVLEAMKKLKVSSTRSRNSGNWVVDRQLISSTVPMAKELSREQVEDLGKLLGRDWTDYDETQHKLGKVLGMFPENSKLEECKWVFWTENKLTERLGRLVCELAEPGGPLQNRTTPDYQFRFVPNLI